MASFKVILGSSSASRKQILSEMGYQFTVMGADIDEKEIRCEKTEDLVMALAHAKADAIIKRLKQNGFEEKFSESTLLITADQVVLHGGVIREKPKDADEAREFIQGYSESRNTFSTIFDSIELSFSSFRSSVSFKSNELEAESIAERDLWKMISI